jgi:hypothetical protein
LFDGYLTVFTRSNVDIALLNDAVPTAEAVRSRTREYRLEVSVPNSEHGITILSETVVLNLSPSTNFAAKLYRTGHDGFVLDLLIFNLYTLHTVLCIRVIYTFIAKKKYIYISICKSSWQ